MFGLFYSSIDCCSGVKASANREQTIRLEQKYFSGGWFA
jgi:hypothetical protein